MMKSLKLFLASVAIFAIGMLLSNTSEAQVTSLQVIGTFPKTDGGFEGQTAGTIWNKTGFKDTSISVWTVNTGPATIITTGGRSGPQYANLTYTGSGGHPIQSPTADSGAIRASTVYVVQYYYRTSTATGTNAVMTVCGAVNGTVDGFTSRPSPAIALAGTSGNWQKHTDTLGMYTALTPKCGYVGIRPSGAMGIALDIDDFVAYAGGIDSVAPNPSTSLTATPKSDGTKIRLNWTAPSTGVDSGGYMVVRGLADPSTAPNTNGIYAVGNTIATGQQVVYLGTGTSFVDTALTMGAQYYYRIYTVDKAFNYSSALSVNATTYTLGPNLLLNGTFGSETNWTGPLTIGSSAANTFDFNYSAAIPTGGTAPCLRILQLSGATNAVYYQAVTLTSGIYALDGLIKNSTSTSADYWVELYLTSKLPTNLGPDVVAIKDTTVEVAWLKQSGWGGVDNYDGKLSALASSMQDTIRTAGTYYFVIKAGTLGTGKLDAVIDNLTINKIADVVITIPAAPQNLVMTDSSSQTITIKWRKNTEADFLRYRIYQGTSAAPTTKVDSTTGGITDTSKTFTGLTNGTRYYLRVTAVNSSGMESPYSNEVNGVPNINPIPAAPQNLVITDTSNQAITIKWRKNAEADFLRYRIYRGISSAPTTKVDSTSGGVKTDTSKTFTGLISGTKYYLRVTAVDSAGNESPYSNEVNGVPNSPVPATPLQVIGMFPKMDGGFEGQKGGSVWVKTGFKDTSITSWTVNTGPAAINTSGGRSGPQYVKYSYTGSGGHPVQSPTSDSGAIHPATLYTVQYYYRSIDSATANVMTCAISPNGTASIGGWKTSANSILAATHNTWQKKADTMTIGASTDVKYGLACVRASGAMGIPSIDIDDFVAYAGGIDTVAPNPATTPIATPKTGGTKIQLGWTAPSNGVDSGGYMVVRGSADPSTAPNTNGIYAVGNTIATGQKVVYLGTSTSFVDSGLVMGIKYYYRIYAVDKAFNYSSALNVNVTTLTNYTLGPNLITNGNFGSATGWTGPLAVGGTTSCVYDFNYSTDFPAGGTAPCLRMSQLTAGSSVNSVYYQAVTLTSGQIYGLDGLIKISNSASSQYWIEFYLTSKLPTNLGPDVVANGDTTVELAWLKPAAWGGVDNYNGRLFALASSRPDTIKKTGTYYFIIKSGTYAGMVDAVLDNLTLNNLIFTGVKNEPESVVESFGLQQNYPNPFNPSTSITYQVSKEGFVSIKVYDLIGREVATLVNEVKHAGSYSIQWNAAGMSSGIYFCKMQANSFSMMRKMILLK